MNPKASLFKLVKFLEAWLINAHRSCRSTFSAFQHNKWQHFPSTTLELPITVLIICCCVTFEEGFKDHESRVWIHLSSQESASHIRVLYNYFASVKKIKVIPSSPDPTISATLKPAVLWCQAIFFDKDNAKQKSFSGIFHWLMTKTAKNASIYGETCRETNVRVCARACVW